MSSGETSITQLRPIEMFDLFGCNFQPRYESSFAWKSAVSSILALPGLRSCWPMSGFDNTGAATDFGCLNKHLTYHGNLYYSYHRLAPYVHFDGTGDYLSYVDDPDFDIIGNESYVAAKDCGLTFGGWFYFDGAAGVSNEAMMAKWLTTGDQRSYEFYRTAVTGTVTFAVSSLGTAASTVTCVSTATIGATTWTFVAARFDPSTELKLWLNDTAATQLVGVPATLHNGSAAFTIGATAFVTSYMIGRASLCWICATYLSDSHIFQLYHQQRALFNV